MEIVFLFCLITSIMAVLFLPFPMQMQCFCFTMDKPVLCTSPEKANHHLKTTLWKIRASSKDQVLHQLWEVQSVNSRAAWKNVVFRGVHFAFHTILTRITDCEGEKILKSLSPYPLISQMRKMFTCERTVDGVTCPNSHS